MTPSRAVRAALLATAAIGVTTACPGTDSPTGPFPSAPKVHECWVIPGPDFPDDGDVNVDKPSSCPFKIPGQQMVSFTADGTFMPGSIQYHQVVSTNFYNDRGNYWGTVSSSTWGSDAYSREVLLVTGQWYAGTAGFFRMDFSEDVADTSYTLIYSNRVHAMVYAKGILQYRQGDPAVGYVVASDGNPLPNTSFSLQANTQDADAVGPISYHWWVNGTDLGVGAQVITGNAGAMGNVQDFTFEATDQGNGHVMTAGYHVQTRTCNTPGCNDQ